MHIQHVALGTTDLETMVAFYKKYFGAVEHATYHNEKTGLRICFLEFDKGARLEIMTRPAFVHKASDHGIGYSHIALHAGDAECVDIIVKRLVDDGHTIVSPPRVDGYGHYECTAQDPDGNWIEITAGRVKGR